MMSVNIIQKVRFKRYSALWGGDKLICIILKVYVNTMNK